jgi:hypothetical protein
MTPLRPGRSSRRGTGRSYRAKRRSAARVAQRRRPLWLTAQEARTLAVLSGSGVYSHSGGPRAATDEQRLFARLGRYLRSF